MNSPSTPPQPLLVWWSLWASFQAGIFVIYFVLGKSAPTHSLDEPTFWRIAFLPVLLSGALRWSLLPNIKDATRALAIFIVGLALAESSCFLGLFLFPSHKASLFVASLLGIFQFIPLYASRYSNPGSNE